ncbi:Hypothetical predicted protein [Marmota monax]|uniref:CST complex subunit TEN1 n=2 Tax=Marmota monax TaxID=9995 RepID=A0A5E4APJ6_MARMO|nr:Hypothetical predicted protein [Marmota monax]VTJ59403.1 Hypothetical predicted protein [Marmota monax]
MLTLNLWSSCSSSQVAGITGVHHHAELKTVFNCISLPTRTSLPGVIVGLVHLWICFVFCLVYQETSKIHPIWFQEPTMLPKPGIYYFPWEVSAGQVPDGGTLRTFGRLCLYDVTQSRVTLRAQHGSDQHQVLVCTKLVEPFQAQVGSLYVVLGELEQEDDGGYVVKARLLTCVEGINLPSLEQAILEQRLYQQERGSSQ